MTMSEQERARALAAARGPRPRPTVESIAAQNRAALNGGQPTDHIAQLLAAAEQHPYADIRRRAQRLRAGIDELRTRIAAAQDRVQAETRMTQLRKQLAEAEAEVRRLRNPAAVTVDHRVVREWARANGMPCPAMGRVPNRVIKAWREATR